MTINLYGVQKTLVFWCKALGPKIEGYFSKEFQIQIDLVAHLAKEIKAQICVLENETVFFLGFDLFDLLSLSIHWSRRCDHPGIEITTKVIFVELRFQYRDLRHWDYENDKFKHITEL